MEVMERMDVWTVWHRMARMGPQGAVGGTFLRLIALRNYGQTDDRR